MQRFRPDNRYRNAGTTGAYFPDRNSIPVQELTPPEESVLDLAVKYIRACTATSNQSQEGCHITTRTILELASQEGIDVGNQTRVGHLLSDLEFKRIMECVTGRKQGSRSKYVLALALDKSGGVTGIRPSLISQISAPDEIRRTLASQPRTFRVEDSTDPYKLDEKEGGDGQ